jgi:hypothetical protein
MPDHDKVKTAYTEACAVGGPHWSAKNANNAAASDSRHDPASQIHDPHILVPISAPLCNHRHPGFIGGQREERSVHARRLKSAAKSLAGAAHPVQS